jgi:hypothetical protein
MNEEQRFKPPYAVVNPKTGEVVHSNMTKNNAHKESSNMGGRKKATIVLDPDAKVGDILRKFIAEMPFQFPDERKAKQFDQDVVNSGIGIGDRVGNKVTVTDVDTKWRAALKKYMKKSKGKYVVKESFSSLDKWARSIEGINL